MAIAIVQSVSAGSSDGANVTSAGINTSGADGIVVAMASSSGSPATGVSDSKSNTYSALTAQPASAGGSHIQLFYCAAPTVGSGHTFSNIGGTFQALIAVALSGTNASPFYDGQQSTADGMQAGSITPSQANCIAVAAFAYSSTSTPYTIDGGFTIVDQMPLVGGQHYGIGLAYLIQTSAAAANPTWAGSGTLAASAIAAFRASGGGGGGSTFPALGVAL